jgi:hypothetical protein
VIRAGWQIRIERPIQQVFDYVADPAHASVWSTDAGRYELTRDLCEPPSELGFLARNSKAEALVRFHFEAAGDAATDVSCEVELTFKGMLRALEPVMAAVARRGVEQSRGPALKAALEAQ